MPEGAGPAGEADAVWRGDLDALEFVPAGHLGRCMVHRLAFRSLLRSAPGPEDCLTFFARERAAFQAAARSKLTRTDMPSDRNFHLTSRDIARALRFAHCGETVAVEAD
ncbi:hypothetical protein SAMN05216548_102447 [Faunimonas pinastri]|uniref:Uncharacterized protein n=1 Tax=Faunimonas pinastri TaxID=1855383 RepID=A0A1H9DFQ0_9HYPH|nr:hypothetical protein [Faunimonas pinastri]SEQ12211.1 hypothetical protein SAMN05216548_102447 [Faunimonas pinastri]